MPKRLGNHCTCNQARMRAACSSQADGGAAPLGFPKPSVYNSFAWSSDAVTPLACFTQMDFSFLDFLCL